MKELLFPNIFNQLNENTVEPHCFAPMTGRSHVHHSTMTILQRLSAKS